MSGEGPPRKLQLRYSINWSALIFATVLGALSGYYIFNEPAKSFGQRERERQLALQSEGTTTDGATESSSQKNIPVKSAEIRNETPSEK